jgi:hypothetical protein
MEVVVLGWFVLTLTDSPFLVGLVSGARMGLNFLFGSISTGVVAGVWGAPWAANMSGALGIALVGILALFTPKLRNV